MARHGIDYRIFAIALSAVVLVVAALSGIALYCLETHPSAQRPIVDAGPSDVDPVDAAPLPDELGPRCGGPIVTLVKEHPSKVEGKTIEEQAAKQLEELASAEGAKAIVLGWRGREDREKRFLCRVSFRYQLGEQHGATVWLVDPEAPPHSRLEPQDLLSVEITGLVDWPEKAEQEAFHRRCKTAGVEKVQRHFSYKEDYTLWRALRKRAIEVRRETGKTIEYGTWTGIAEGPERCLISVAFTEDSVPKRAYFRLKYLPREEYAVEPLTPRAIEVIYGPGVFSR